MPLDHDWKSRTGSKTVIPDRRIKLIPLETESLQMKREQLLKYFIFVYKTTQKKTSQHDARIVWYNLKSLGTKCIAAYYKFIVWLQVSGNGLLTVVAELNIYILIMFRWCG